MKNKIDFTVDKNLKHIAFIMDGNGRWATMRGLDRPEGHKVGVKVFENIANLCFDIGLEAVTFYAFSTENWKRPPAEIKVIMGLLSFYLDKCRTEFIKKGVRVQMLGDKSPLDEGLKQKILALENDTRHFTKTLNIAINYGGRDEIVHACNELLSRGEEITVGGISKSLYTGDCVEPDMIIRTAGEKRLSNFLLWQSSYSELYFTDTLWPDFDEDDLILAINDFYARRRKYGGL